MRLTIKQAEEKGASCGTKNKLGDRCRLSYDEHTTALLIEVNHKNELKDVPGLQEYLKKIGDRAKEDGFVGFAFKQKEK